MMMSRGEFDEYVNSLNYITEEARTRFANDVWAVWELTRDVDLLRDAISMFGASYAQTYGSVASMMAADLWERIYYNDTGEHMSADVDGGEWDEAMEATADWMLRDGIEDDAQAADAIRRANDRMARYVMAGARLTMTRNTRRAYERGARKARWARIPTGPETCAFCIMLASRGFVYLSEESAGGLDPDHYHDNCDCQVVAGFSDDSAVDGFDHTELYDMYLAAREYDDHGRVDLSATLANMRQRYGFR